MPETPEPPRCFATCPVCGQCVQVRTYRAGRFLEHAPRSPLTGEPHPCATGPPGAPPNLFALEA